MQLLILKNAIEQLNSNSQRGLRQRPDFHAVLLITQRVAFVEEISIDYTGIDKT